MKKLLSILVAGLIAVSSVTALGSQSASAAGHRADVDVIAACLYQYQGAYTAGVKLVENNVMGWRCYINNYKPGLLDIDVKGWCKHKYGNRAAAKYDDFNNPYSWYCEY